MNIYLDMDDVVADWMGYAKKIVNRNWEYGQRIPQYEWNRLREDQRMYRNLPLMPGAQELVQWCREYCNRTDAGLYFLSAIPHDNDMPWAIQDKVLWALEHFPDIPVFLGPYSHDKWRRCKPGDVLIDDRVSNCEEWQREGGIAHIYKGWETCKPWLESTLDGKV